MDILLIIILSIFTNNCKRLEFNLNKIKLNWTNSSLIPVMMILAENISIRVGTKIAEQDAIIISTEGMYGYLNAL